MKDRVELTGMDNEGKEVKFVVKKPTPKDYRESQVAYNKGFRDALESGAMLKAKLYDFVREQGIWDDRKEEQYRRLSSEIAKLEGVLKRGGIPLKQAKDTAMQLAKTRDSFRDLISERQSYDSNTAESQADNARFNFLVSCCVYKEDGVTKMWRNQEEYDLDGIQPWAILAASELAKILYGLEPDFEAKLPENEFLYKYKFVNKDLKLINKDGHLIDEQGRLVDEDNRLVAYREDGTKYYVNRLGQEIDKEGNLVAEFVPFTDDDGNPILLDEAEPEQETREDQEEKPSKKKRTTKEE